MKSRGAGLFPCGINISEISFRARFLAGHGTFANDDELCPFYRVCILDGVGVNEGHHGLLVGLSPDHAFLCRGQHAE